MIAAVRNLCKIYDKIENDYWSIDWATGEVIVAVTLRGVQYPKSLNRVFNLAEFKEKFGVTNPITIDINLIGYWLPEGPYVEPSWEARAPFLEKTVDHINPPYSWDPKRSVFNKVEDSVNHPSHYGGADNPYEAIKVIDNWKSSFCIGNAIKYLSRAGKKDASKTIEDLEKSIWYIQHEIEELKKKK